jgi:hypothetical protein
MQKGRAHPGSPFRVRTPPQDVEIARCEDDRLNRRISEDGRAGTTIDFY